MEDFSELIGGETRKLVSPWAFGPGLMLGFPQGATERIAPLIRCGDLYPARRLRQELVDRYDKEKSVPVDDADFAVREAVRDYGTNILSEESWSVVKKNWQESESETDAAYLQPIGTLSG